MLEQAAGKGVQRLVFTLNVYFHLAGAVTHPATQLEGLCQPVDKGAKAHTLHTAGQCQVQCLDVLRGRAGEIQIHISEYAGHGVQQQQDEQGAAYPSERRLHVSMFFHRFAHAA
jgi:hypothetical protein